MKDKLSFTRVKGGGQVYLRRSTIVSVTKGVDGTNIRIGAGDIFFDVLEPLDEVVSAVWPEEESQLGPSNPMLLTGPQAAFGAAPQ
jgi:hypothetical protein